MGRKRTRRSLRGHFGESLAHWPHLALYFSSDRTCGPQWGSCGTCETESAVPPMPTNIPGDISDVKFLTVAEVAAVMRVSKMTVYRLVHNGELPAVRVGRSFRVSEDDVNEYLKSSFFDAG